MTAAKEVRARFWFESLQNRQSEFLAIAAMVWLAVYLRQRWSPESKPVHTAHEETGREMTRGAFVANLWQS